MKIISFRFHLPLISTRYSLFMGLNKNQRLPFLLGASLPLAAAALILAWAHRDDKQALSEIDALLHRGAREFQTCRNFRERWEALTGNLAVSQDRLAHASKEDALKVLAELEKYPGWSPSYAEAADFFDDNAADLDRNLLQPSLIARRYKIAPDCEMIGFYRHALLLLQDKTHFHLHKDDERRIDFLITSYLTAEPNFHSFLEGGIKSALLVAFLTGRHGEQEALEHAKKLSENFEARRRDISRITQGEPRFWRELSLRSRNHESRQTRELFRSYYRVLREARI